ncbi:hypothetical protein PIB30_058749 [Stylosanthes scabra]|uniref:Uncharacterized protein n=1 Tax=Stylosanthes scabra TaxID=79078 RepID=A0ABU6YJD3_9FABA|nr:hypothetical protein [Stylosanthes scabra]
MANPQAQGASFFFFFSAIVFVPPCIEEDVEKLLDIHWTMDQVELNVDLVAFDVGGSVRFLVRVKRFLPSLVVAAVIFLLKFIISPKSNPWGTSFQAIREKYKQHKVSTTSKACTLAVLLSETCN